MKRFNWLDWTAFTLLIVGGLNWGLVGLFKFNLVTAIFGTALLSNMIFTVVGLSALFAMYSLTKVRPPAMMEATREEDTIRRAA